MTREEIEALTPEQVNAYLAEKVMGWVREGSRWYMGESGGDSEGDFICTVDEYEPHLSLDDAMRAAEKEGFTQRRNTATMTFFELKYGSRWHAGWFLLLGAEHITASADTPALAVCRAVIAAHEAGKEPT